MLATNVLEVLGWIVENAWEILLIISVIVGGIQTWRTNRGKFWKDLKETAEGLIQEAEAMPDFKPGEGSLKRDYVIEKLLEEFGTKFSFISTKKLEKIVDGIVKGFNIFKKLK